MVTATSDCTAASREEIVVTSAKPLVRLDDLPEFLRVDEVASVLRVSRGCVYEMVAEGRLVSVRAGRLLRIPREAILALAGK